MVVEVVDVGVVDVGVVLRGDVAWMLVLLTVAIEHSSVHCLQLANCLFKCHAPVHPNKNPHCRARSVPPTEARKLKC